MAKVKLETVEMTRPDGEAIIYVPKRSNFTRIIVTLTRNKNMWLTSLGWRPEEKSVALACDNTASGLAIKLPKKFARDIRPEDVIAITCAELGFEGEVEWGGTVEAPAVPAPDIEPPAAAAPAAETPALAGAAQGSPNSKKLLLSGIAALAVLGVLGVTLMGGDKTPDETKQAEAVVTEGGVSASTEVDAETSSSASVTEQDREAAEAVAAEISAKKEEAERLEAKAIQDEKDAALKAEAEETAAARRELERVEAEQEEAAEKIRAEKVKSEREAADRKEAAEREEAADRKKAAEEKANKARADRRAAAARKKARDEAAAKAADRTEAVSAADIRSIQEDLTYMGYYSGAIDGELTSNTVSAIDLFKSIFELPEGLEVNKTLLQAVEKERRLFVKEVPVATPAAITPAPTTAVTSVPEVFSEPAPAPEIFTAQPSASFVSPVTSDITDPVLLKRPDLDYPHRPRNRSSFQDVVTVVVSYGVDKAGKPINVKVTSNDHTGIFEKDFDNAAVRYGKAQRFEPALRGDTPVQKDNLSVTLSFQK